MRDDKERMIVFKNAPLREVVVELHWELQPLSALAGAAIDPFYNDILTQLKANLEIAGFTFVESKVPDDVPLEVVPHQATKIFRRSANEWPVYQLGPGVFTANDGQPYTGWREFFAFLKDGFHELFKSHPNPEYLKPSHIVVRYMNLFTDGHGLKDVNDFLQTHLGVSINLTPGINKSIAPDGELFIASEIRFPLSVEKNALGVIAWSPVPLGDGKVGLGLDFNVFLGFNDDNQELKIEQSLEKVNIAHDLVCEWFKSIATEDLWKQLEPEFEA